MNRESSSRPLRIVLYAPPTRGGICHYTWELAEHLAQAGNDTIVWTGPDNELGDLPRHFRVRHFKRSWIRALLNIVTARSPREPEPIAASESARVPHGRDAEQRLRRMRSKLVLLKSIAGLAIHRPDVVHFQWLGDRDHDLWFIRRIQQLGIPVVYTAHDVLPHEGDSAAERDFLERLYRLPERLIVHTSADRRELIETFRVPNDRISVIPHGAYDFRFGRPATVDKAGARRLLDISTEKKVVLFFGLIKRYKGIEHLISAFDLVQRRISDAFLLIVGEVFRGDPDEYRYYSALLEKLRERENVRVVTRYVPVEEIPVYLSVSDLVALPYTHTSQSGVLLAAYGAGRPVVVTETGGLAEIVEPGETGCTVPARDAGALAEAIAGILSDPSRAAVMGEKARTLAVSRYGWAGVARQTVEAYILAGARKGIGNSRVVLRGSRRTS